MMIVLPLQVLHGEKMAPRTIHVAMGRTLEVARVAGKICCFTFAELCGANVGADDYIALVNEVHTIALKQVPIFTDATRSDAYRFVKLIDLMYEHRTKLLVSASAYAKDLFKNVLTQEQGRAQKGDMEGMVVDDILAFAKDRTVSRLTEMQTLEYALAHAERHEPRLVMALEEAQAKQQGRAKS
jgi:peroxisome-assembly ATPase